MAKALADIRDRVEVFLMDTGNAVWDTGTIDESIHQALDEYTQAWPLGKETVITLPGDGREVALSGLTDLVEVTQVWWPYDSDAASETWPPNKVRGWRLWWDDAQPVLFLDITDGSQPQTNEEMRIWYVIPHTIQDLESASTTTIQDAHISKVVEGAAAKAALARSADLVETANTDLYAIQVLATWAKHHKIRWNVFLENLRKRGNRFGPTWGEGWDLDKWDER
jgi:hypothetical protein